jgi:hypothetical protein
LSLEVVLTALHHRLMTTRFSFILFSLLFGAALFVVLQAGAQTPLDNEIQKVFSWLPADTETVVVADSRKRSFLDLELLSKHEDDDEAKGRPASVQDVATWFQVMPMGFFSIKGGLLLELFRNHPLALTIEGSRHFRGPRGGLGMMDYEGCAIAVFKDDVGRDGESLLNRHKAVAVNQEEIEGKVATIFEEDWEAIWTLHVIFPQPDVLMVCSNRDYAQQVLQRMKQAALVRALPPDLPEWKYVNTSAPFWGLRHFDRSQAELDPSSPFSSEKTFNSPDEQGIGITFSFDPNLSNQVIATYLSGDPDIKRKLRGDEPSLYDHCCYEDTEEHVLVSSNQLRPGIIQYSFAFPTVAHLGLFFFGFEGMLGHGVYV